MKTLVAGFGNIFLSDDGFGSAVARRLPDVDLGPDVLVRDFGTGGMHLAMEMLGGYDLVIIVDAVARPEPPGTLFTIDCTRECRIVQSPADAHAMTITAALEFYARLRDELGIGHHPNIVVAGCVPQSVDEGMDLSEPVRAAVPVCVDLIQRLTREGVMTGAQP